MTQFPQLSSGNILGEEAQLTQLYAVGAQSMHEAVRAELGEGRDWTSQKGAFMASAVNCPSSCWTSPALQSLFPGWRRGQDTLCR